MLRFLRKIILGERLTKADQLKMQTDSMVRQMKYRSFIKKGMSMQEARRRSNY